jgi:hypothetical protein
MLYAMNPIDWLYAKAPGFSALSKQERTAIMHFSLLWSFFEAKMLNTRASATAILTLTHNLAAQGRLNVIPFTKSLDYFRDRYYKDGVATDYFSGLNFRGNDNQALVRAVLKRENTNPADCVAALLIIVYRLRNNLFHGVKWEYEIEGQLDNFTHANTVLMAALDIHLSGR